MQLDILTPEKNIYFFNYRSGQQLAYDANDNLVFVYNRVDEFKTIHKLEQRV